MKISDIFHLVQTEVPVAETGKQVAVKPVQAAVQIGGLSLQLGQLLQGEVVASPQKGLVELLVGTERFTVPLPQTTVQSGQKIWLQVQADSQQAILAPAGQNGAIPALLKNLAGILPHLPDLGHELAALKEPNLLFAPLSAKQSATPPAGPKTAETRIGNPQSQTNLEPSLRLMANMAGLGAADPAPELATKLIGLFQNKSGMDSLHKLLSFFMTPRPVTAGQQGITTGSPQVQMLSILAQRLPATEGSLARQVLGDDTSFFKAPLTAENRSGPALPPGDQTLSANTKPEALLDLARLAGVPVSKDVSLPALYKQIAHLFQASGQTETVPKLLNLLSSLPLPAPASPGLSLLLPLAELLPQPSSTTGPTVLQQPSVPLPTDLVPLLTLASTSLDATPKPAIIHLLSMLGGKTSLQEMGMDQAGPVSKGGEELPVPLQKLVNLLETHSVINREPAVSGQSDLLFLPCFFSSQAGWGEWFWRQANKEESDTKESAQEELFFFLEMTILGPLTFQISMKEKMMNGTITLTSEKTADLVTSLLPGLCRRLENLGWHAQIRCQVKELNLLQEMKDSLQGNVAQGESQSLVDVQA